jgi:hypothetical protein
LYPDHIYWDLKGMSVEERTRRFHELSHWHHVVNFLWAINEDILDQVPGFCLRDQNIRKNLQ